MQIITHKDQRNNNYFHNSAGPISRQYTPKIGVRLNLERSLLFMAAAILKTVNC